MDLKSKLVRIIQDDEVQRLSVLINRFNPFDVLRVGYYELRHTNTLAWLLDPSGNHGLNDMFLRAFIARLGDAKSATNLMHDYETAADRSVIVRREVPLTGLVSEYTEEQQLGLVQDEGENENDKPTAPRKVSGNGKREGAIDILIDGDGWVMGLEAKVRSGEGKGQLEKYFDKMVSFAKENNKSLCVVYLTIDGEEPSNNNWVPASWRECVLDPLEKILDIRQDLHSDVRAFLLNYLQTLKRHTGSGDDAETLARDIANQESFVGPLNALKAALAKKSDEDQIDKGIERILRRHAPVIRMLLDQLVSPQGQRAKTIEQLLVDHGFKRLKGPASYIPFVPAGWTDGFREMLSYRDGCVLFEVVNREPKMTIKLLVPSLGQNADDPLVDARRKLVEIIHDNQDRDHFPGAFYRREVTTPRPAAERYYSIYTESLKINKDTRTSKVEKWVNKNLENISDNMLGTLERYMRDAGLK